MGDFQILNYFVLLLCLCVCVCVCVCRGFVQRCAQCDPAVSEDSLRRANKALDHIVQQGVRVLFERLYLHIRVTHTHTHTETC